MKSIVVYYSLTGNIDSLATTIAKLTDADICKLELESEYPKNFFKFVKGGHDAVRHLTPKLKTILPDLSQYDRIYIGSPVWASTYAPPIGSFLENYPLENKEIALFISYMGRTPGHTFKDMLAYLEPQNDLLDTIEFINPKKSDPEVVALQLKQWIETLDTNA